MNDRGETLIEMIISLALFSLTITMLVTVFHSANASLYSTVDTKRTLSNQETSALSDTNLEKVETQSVTCVITTSTDTFTSTFDVDLMHVENGAFYRFK